MKGGTCQVTNKHYCIPYWTCISLQGEKDIYTYVKIIHGQY